MKLNRLSLLLLLAVPFTACEDDDDNAPSLNAQWKLYSSKVLTMGDQSACDYQVKPSDMDGAPSTAACQVDDVYDFSNNKELIIQNGDKKCTPTESATTAKPYERQGDQLMIDGQAYSIVRLTQDTLILSHCTNLPSATGFTNGKVGMKFIRN
ncbi:hypothetical protein GU926_11445 [Nibribacter ruber]|uniref:Lipocalin-like domain-containing protein n=1 Tax=Nibribacter ruber TaxID=2698458 RepID=A0A6P1P063_9BACT|nr:hypothetical protein [Nibribacter ruber]QHL88009.1 hypothetical protein GU926_11445 [Nibribacter ruber]